MMRAAALGSLQTQRLPALPPNCVGERPSPLGPPARVGFWERPCTEGAVTPGRGLYPRNGEHIVGGGPSTGTRATGIDSRNSRSSEIVHLVAGVSRSLSRLNSGGRNSRSLSDNLVHPVVSGACARPSPRHVPHLSPSSSRPRQVSGRQDPDVLSFSDKGSSSSARRLARSRESPELVSRSGEGHPDPELHVKSESGGSTTEKGTSDFVANDASGADADGSRAPHSVESGGVSLAPVRNFEDLPPKADTGGYLTGQMAGTVLPSSDFESAAGVESFAVSKAYGATDSSDSAAAAIQLPVDPGSTQQQSGSSRVLQSVLVACIGSFAFGYHISIVNGPLPHILADISSTGSSLVGGWIVSISLAAAAVGALLGGLLADALGRRKALLADCVPIIVGSVISATATSVPQMLLGRAIVGAGFGVASSVVPLYISEVSPAKARGFYGSFNQLTICIGIVGALLAGLPLAQSPGWWRMMFWIGAVPALLLAAGLLFVAPETPAWLQKKGRLAEARQAEANLSGASMMISDTQRQRKGSGLGEDVEEALGTRQAGFGELFSRKYRSVVLIGMLIFAIQQFAGINAVIYYSSSVFQRVGITSDIAASALVAAANVLGTLVSSQLVDSQGRKKLLVTSFAGMGLSMLLLALTLSLAALQPFPGVLSVLGTVTYVLAFALGVGPVPALLLPEIFPAAIRANAIAMSLVSHWVCNFIIGLTFLGMVEAIGIAGSYTAFALVCVVGIAFVHLVLPETKGRSLEELEAQFASGKDL